MKEKLLQATKDILEHNMQIMKAPFCDQKVVLVYDEDSKLSKMLWEAYWEAIHSFSLGGKDAWRVDRGLNTSNTGGGFEIILFSEASTDKKELQDFLLWLDEWSTVILVQSTNFRLDGFRIRLNLKNAWVWCLEHAHLWYILDDQIENYIDSICYHTPYYEALSDWFKEIVQDADTLTMKTHDGNILTVEWWFEDIKRNTWDFSWKYRWGNFPIGENFTESLDFARVNGTFSVFAFPDENFQVVFTEPFVVEVQESKLTCTDPKCPQQFRDLLTKIEASEDDEVFVRELWFGMNKWISKDKRLSDIWAYERVTGFHMSLGKKHQIYRKKIHKSVAQRYHIDIFPHVDTIHIDGKLIFENEQYVFDNPNPLSGAKWHSPW